MSRGKGFFPGSPGGELPARSVAEGSSADGDELARSLGGGRGGPDERNARAAASAFAAMAPSVAARSAAFAGCSERRTAAPVSFAAARRDDGGGGIALRSAGETADALDPDGEDGTDARTGRGGVEPGTAEPAAAAPADGGAFTPRCECAEVGASLVGPGDAADAPAAGDTAGDTAGDAAGDAAEAGDGASATGDDVNPAAGTTLLGDDVR